jgi:NTP pyrophosphatase (non-canonical NTP hydrolase)
MSNSVLDELTEKVLGFRDERNWAQFHSLKNLAAGLSIEAGELQELFLWKSDAEAEAYVNSEEGKTRLGEEMADVLVYLLLLADIAKIDLKAASDRKIELNAKKYPVEKSYNSATKYTELA